jgi:hypothetical protein
MVSIGGVYFYIIISTWAFFFFLSHFQFVRLTRFSLKLEEEGKIRRLADAKTSLFTAAGIESMVAFAAFLPATVYIMIGYFMKLQTEQDKELVSFTLCRI